VAQGNVQGLEMSNGRSVLDESASALFAYDAPEIERSKALLEELCRSFDGNARQGRSDVDVRKIERSII
jgi:hypothetical protein